MAAAAAAAAVPPQRLEGLVRRVRRRCVCLICLHRRGLKIRNPALELVDELPTEMRLPEPPELEWKREMRRRR